jgi:cysteine desulfurase/selenocysteine lyase
MNIAQEVGLAAAVDYMESLGMQAVRVHEEELTAYALDGLLEAGARIIGPKDVSVRGGEISFWYKDIHPHDIATVLSDEGVAVRAGHHCAQPVMRRFGVPATTRASFYIYNTKHDVDALLDALERAGALFAV